MAQGLKHRSATLQTLGTRTVFKASIAKAHATLKPEQTPKSAEATWWFQPSAASASGASFNVRPLFLVFPGSERNLFQTRHGQAHDLQ